MMTSGHRVAAPVLGLLLGLSACGAGGSDPGEDPETTGTVPEIPAGPGDDDADSPDDPRVQDARADLAERTGADPGDIEVVEQRSVTWPDGSIGCPEEGMSYIQVLTEGDLLVLAADGVEHRYHAAAEEDFFYCADPQDALPADSEQ
ncbi:hypothetical protein [Pseudactinotalea sp. Z1748]|uniref:hypothetical protein n=1 Tax=Pseudactinotalea sp. Z1748 TaxID=3413027 RepID=UPI003C7EB3B6